jgi:hypothetical protein
MSNTHPRLYDLLPAYVRYRDAHEGEPLRAVMEALELPFGVILEDIDALYRGWFIETCEDWVVPYIGDLVGVRGLDSARQVLPSQRNLVANALAYRRSKGTPAALERAACDATGWACRAVDYRQALATTASLLKPSAGGQGGYADLRRMGDLDELGGPFNVLSHTADLRPSDPASPPLGDRGGFHLLNLGLAFWRLESYPVAGGTPREVLQGIGEGAGYTFHPFGLDAPLFNPPQTAVPSVYSSTERQVPAPLRRLALSAEATAGEYFGDDPVFRILVSEAGEAGFRPIPPAALAICDLEDWTFPEPAARGARIGRNARVAVDPVRGRFLFSEPAPGRRVRVDYSYGMSMDLGGGPYPRNDVLLDSGVPAWRAVVAEDCEPRFDAAEKVHYFTSLSAAVQAWSHGRSLPIPTRSRALAAPRSGVIRICDSGTYEAGLPVNVKGRWLAIQAAEGCCPSLRGGLEVMGSPAEMLEAADPTPDSPARPGDDSHAGATFRQSQLSLAGLWIEGGIRVQGGASLVLEHCTVAPPVPGRAAAAVRFVAEEEGAEKIERIHAVERTTVKANRCILGGLDLGARPVELEMTDCIVDAGGDTGSRAIDGPHAAARIVRCTLLGEVHLGRLSFALGVLFQRRVRVAVPSEGTVRFSYIPEGSRVPPQERCIGAGGSEAPSAPAFTSRSFGDPAYAQLSPDSSFELRHGGEDGNEIGVYNSLRQSDRLANLPTVLDELLPWGMTARISFVT